MAENHTLLADLIPRLNVGIENVAVEALWCILNKSPAALEALNELVRAGYTHMAKVVRVQTQSMQTRGREQTRLDLVGIDKSGAERVLIEAKFWAGLTDHQPKGYLNRLPEDEEPAVLLFVAPEDRVETLWASLRRRVAGQLGQAKRVGSVFSAGLSGTRKRLMLVSWQHLLDEIDKAAGTAGERDVQGDVQQLLGLTQRMDAQAFLPITDRDRQSWGEFARRNRDYVKLVKDVVDQEKDRGWLVIKGHRMARQDYGYGRNMTIFETRAWLGINYELCAITGKTPLWIWLSADPNPKIFDELEQELHIKLYSFEDGSRKNWIPIPLKACVEFNEVREDVVHQLRTIASVIKPA